MKIQNRQSVRYIATAVVCALALSLAYRLVSTSERAPSEKQGLRHAAIFGAL